MYLIHVSFPRLFFTFYANTLYVKFHCMVVTIWQVTKRNRFGCFKNPIRALFEYFVQKFIHKQWLLAKHFVNGVHPFASSSNEECSKIVANRVPGNVCVLVVYLTSIWYGVIWNCDLLTSKIRYKYAYTCYAFQNWRNIFILWVTRTTSMTGRGGTNLEGKGLSLIRGKAVEMTGEEMIGLTGIYEII